jgi:hypothetical protein
MGEPRDKNGGKPIGCPSLREGRQNSVGERGGKDREANTISWGEKAPQACGGRGYYRSDVRQDGL